MHNNCKNCSKATKLYTVNKNQGHIHKSLYFMFRQSEISFNSEQEAEEILIHFVEDDDDDELQYLINDDSKRSEVLEEIDENQFVQLIDPEELIINVKDSKGKHAEKQPYFVQVVDAEKRKKENVAQAGKHQCNICGGYFTHMKRHLESHGPYRCMDCLIGFKSEAQYEDHLLKVHNQKVESYSCQFCPMGFSEVTNLAIHNFKHTGQYTCPICNFTVKGKYRNSLINHIKRHEGNYTIKCEICGQGFIEKSILVSHMEMHEAIPKYECEYCQKKFTVKRYLDVHKSYNHKKEMYGIEEMFQCEVCGRSFTFEKSLVRHLSCIHKIGTDRTVECPVCHKIIANNHNLKRHMRVHTGEKRFCCDTCGKAFSEKKYLQKHQTVHMKERLRKRITLDLSESDEDRKFSSLVTSQDLTSLSAGCIIVKNESDDEFAEEDNEDSKDMSYFSVD